MTASEVIVDTISSCTTTTGPVTAPLSAEPAPGISSAFLVNNFAVKDVPGLHPRTYTGSTTASGPATAVTECPGGSTSGPATLTGTGFSASPEDRFMVGNDGSINGSARTTTTTSEMTDTHVIEWRMSPYSITQPPTSPSALPLQ